MSNRSIGAAFEQMAADYLVSQGAEIIQKNYSANGGEIDIIAKLNDRLLFVEVKRRATNRYGTGAAAVDRNKQNKICKAALHYLKKHSLMDSRMRFDVIEINGEGIRHIPSAFTFQPTGRY